jgi:type II secretory pathway component PulF
MKKKEMTLATLLALVMILALTGSGYLAFVFPRTLDLWRDENRSLSVFQRLVAGASHFCQAYGFLILPALCLGFLGSLAWLAIASRRNTPASNTSEGMPRSARQP